MKLIKDLGFVLTSANNKKKYNCGLYLCNCGNEFITRHEYVKSGHTKSCGCLAKKINAERLKTHGMANTKLYKSWCHMKERCFVKKDKSYKSSLENIYLTLKSSTGAISKLLYQQYKLHSR